MAVNFEEIDKGMHDCMTTIWKAYRTGDIKTFNSCFEPLYAKYDSQLVHNFIAGMGMALVPAANARRENENQNQ